MTDPQIALMMLGLFIVFVFLGFPIAFHADGDGHRLWLLRLF